MAPATAKLTFVPIYRQEKVGENQYRMWSQQPLMEPELPQLDSFELDDLIDFENDHQKSDPESGSNFFLWNDGKIFHELTSVSSSDSGSDCHPSSLSHASAESQQLSPVQPEHQTDFDEELLLYQLLGENDVPTVAPEKQPKFESPKQSQLVTMMDLTSESWLPLYEQQQQAHVPERNFQLPSYHQFDHLQVVPEPRNALPRTYSPDSADEDFEEVPRQTVSQHRDAEIEDMACYIKRVIEKGRAIKSDENSSKLKVHEVILIILLNLRYGDQTKDLRRILAFCDQDGHEITSEGTHFKTLDTETMGLLWKKIKGNKQGNYDTFARAMRVRREKSEGKKSEGYFDYLASGKRSKKKIYKFGEKAMTEMSRMKETLRLVSAPQTYRIEF